MPRYGQRGYDPDYDDSPRPENRRAYEQISPQSTIRLLVRRLWRLRSLLISISVIAGILYLWSHSGRSISRTSHEPGLAYKNVNWKLYAYTQYATDSAHLCNALMVFEALHRLGSKAQRILVYPETMDTVVDDRRDRDSQLLDLAVKKYNVKLVPTKLWAVMQAYPHYRTLSTISKDQIGWDRSISKMLAFNQTDYLRVIHLDNDITLYKHLDDLFFLPSTTIAMPRAYWKYQTSVPLPKSVVSDVKLNLEMTQPLSPHLMIIEPSALEAARVWQEMETISQTPSNFSMDSVVLNKLYKDVAMVLPHRSFTLQTGEFRRSTADHETYLGMASQLVNGTKDGLSAEQWDSKRVLREARLIHFAGDEPLPKPWIMWPKKLYRLLRPKCKVLDGTPSESGCEERETWTNFYEEFRKRRKAVCALLSVPAPDWRPVETRLDEEDPR